MIKALKLTCGSCGGNLQIVGRDRHLLHTVCLKCGADSAPQIERDRLKKKESGTYTISVERIKKRSVNS